MGKKLFWMTAPCMVSFPTCTKLPDSSRDRKGIDRKFMQRHRVKTGFALGHMACLERKNPLLVSPSRFLACTTESIKEVLAYTGLRGTVNSALNKEPSMLCETDECSTASETAEL